MPDLLERLIRELRLEREHEPLRRLAGRVRDDVELDRRSPSCAHPRRRLAPATSYAHRPSRPRGGAMAFAELKARQSVVWGNGPYERITNTITRHPRARDRANRSEAGRARARRGDGHRRSRDHRRQARRGCHRTGPRPGSRRHCARAGVPRRTSPSSSEVGDAEDMRYDDASFDVVMSTCGVMFAPDHEAIARELERVTKPGGRLALACWQPEHRHAPRCSR